VPQVLKESSRRYRQRATDAERHADALEAQLAAAQASVAKLKAQLAEGAEAGSAAEAAAEAALARAQVEALTRAAEVRHATGSAA
jgi:hypothetical protein